MELVGPCALPLVHHDRGLGLGRCRHHHFIISPSQPLAIWYMVVIMVLIDDIDNDNDGG